MENPLPLQTDASVPKLPQKKKYLGLSIFVAICYALPTMVLATLISVLLIFLVVAILEGNFYQLTVFLNRYDFSLQMGILLGVSLLLAVIPSTIIGIASGRMAYKRSNQEGSARRAGFTILAGVGIGLIGLIFFPPLCYAIYIALLFLIDALQLQDSWILALLTGGTESAMAGVIILCIPSIALVLAYLVAIVSSWIVFRWKTPRPPSMDKS